MKRRNYGSGSSRLSEGSAWSKLKRLRDRLTHSPNSLSRALGRTLSASGRLLRYARDKRHRSEVWTRLRSPEQHLQGSTFTLENRYPELFEACRVLLAEISAPRILSFGCSTGEEVRSLAALMPNATIIGVDINAWCVREGRRKNRSLHCTFLQRDSPAFASLVGLDAIFCLAVLQRTEHRTANKTPFESGFTFEQFEREILVLDAKLNPEGLLFIDHADFRFEDTSVAKNYDSIEDDANQRLRRRKLFGSDNTVIAEEYLATRIFKKRAC